MAAIRHRFVGFRRPPRRATRSGMLVVSEDPRFIHAVVQELEPWGIHVIGCLGPLHSRCPLEEHHFCPLADNAGIVLVDSPRNGTFVQGLRTVRAAGYAEDLQRAHPRCAVILCGGPDGDDAPGIVHVASAAAALALIHELVEGSSGDLAVAAVNDGKTYSETGPLRAGAG
ncbi:MAG: hypothetical protein QOH90_2206 [Actinomycetota bacterium]|nr:hypothetical protein [Actinomycetota bacterium]